MKKTTLILLLIFTITKINAQLVTEEINFNNFTSTTNNDLSNKFVQPITYGYSQVSDGNNGYYLTTSLQGTATQPLKLCSKFKGIDTETMVISIDYKVETYPTVISNVYNSVGLFISKDSGETILSSAISNTVNDPYGKILSINGLSNPNSTYNPSIFGNSFISGNWYRLVFELTKIATSKFSISSKIYDIGTDGTSSPVLKVTNTKEGFNYNFSSTNTINIHIVGGYWGDVKYLDNFKVYGFKNGSNCSNLSNTDFQIEDNSFVYPNPFKNQININDEVTKINIYNLNGQLISTYTDINKEIFLDKLANGTYLFEIFSNKGVQIKKLIKQ